ncbi:MAG: hypothetical protein KIS92_15325 [Planctomycetota bacterium]|nr:hypothetical protein [Planctomycetota bacterium]
MNPTRFAPVLLRQRRGSVLVFAIILLVLLFALGTAFVLYVRQEGRASSNALKNAQADAASDAGLAFATRNIRSAVALYSFVTPDGYFVPSYAAQYRNADSAPVAGEPQRNLFRMFEAYPGQTTAAATIADAQGHAWLWHNADGAFFTSAGLEPLSDPLRFTDAKLAHYSTHDGGLKTYYSGGPDHAGLARRFVIDADPAGLKFFYDTAYKQLPLSTWTGGVHAEVYVWIADLDGKLYANPKPDAVSGHPGWGMDAAFANIGSETDQTAATEMLKYVRDYAGMSLVTDGDITGNLYPKSSPYGSTTEIWAQTGIATPASPSGYGYYDARYGLDRYLTPFADDPVAAATAAANQVTTSVKDVASGVNINTANYETLTTMLSRVPLVDGYETASLLSPTDPLVAANREKAAALAARICAKRPFLSRMDFEDFLAAHVNSKAPAVAGDVDDMLAAPATPSGMLYLAMEKRDVTAITPVVFLDLDQYAIDNTQFVAAHPEYANIATPTFMKDRFKFFREDDAVAKLFTDASNNALLTSKALNNLLNATSGKRRDGSYGYSYYSFDNVNIPFLVVGSGTPKFEYQELDQTTLDAGTQQKYTIEITAGTPNEPGELKAWHPTNGSGYYEMTFLDSDDLQLVEYGKPAPGTFMPGDQVIFVSGNTQMVTTNAGNLETPNWSTDQTDGTDIYDFADAAGTAPTCHSTVHGPLRAYRNVEGTGFDEATLKPTADRTSGTLGNGDVAWSPRFAFRSRFFMVYVLSRALQPDGQPSPGGTRRVEAVYDALKDRVIWRRTPATEKRSLGDPEP